MDDKQLEELAVRLRSIYIESRGIGTKPLNEYGSDNEAWLAVAKYVSKIAEAVMTDTLLVYGYNGKDVFEGLDKHITVPDHR